MQTVGVSKSLTSSGPAIADLRNILRLFPVWPCLLLACSPGRTVALHPDPSQLVAQGTFVPEWRLVLDETDAGYVVLDCGLPSDHGIWKPTTADLDRSDASLLEVLGQHLAKTHTHPLGRLVPADYYRLYAPVTMEGRKLLCIRGVHRPWFDTNEADIKTYAGIVDDGGAGIFSAVYDTATGEAARFMFHGE